MTYSIEIAGRYVGKRIIVSLSMSPQKGKTPIVASGVWWTRCTKAAYC